MSKLPFFLAGLLTLGACGGEEQPVAEGPNVLLFVIDTLRADRLGCYGHNRPTSPRLDAFADQALLFEQAYAPSPYTATSHASLFTSTPPSAHGIWNRVQLPDGKLLLPALPERAVTLAERLQDAGYETAAIADGGWISERRGLHQGFQTFESRNKGVGNRVNRALQWLGERDTEQPWFLFLHTYQVHTPYLPQAEFVEAFRDGYEGPLLQKYREARAWSTEHGRGADLAELQRRFYTGVFEEADADDRRFLQALYDAEIRTVDRQFGRLFERLQDEGWLEDTIVIVTSDHGEALWEHGEHGHHQVYEECLRIPLLVWLPDGPRGVRRKDRIDLVDLMPSLLQELELPAAEHAVGRRLDLRATGSGTAPPAFFEANYPHPQIAWRSGDHKLVVHPGQGRPIECFDLGRDPAEQESVADADWARAARGEFEARFEAYLERCRATREVLGLAPREVPLEALGAEEQAGLEALGYVGS